MRDLESDQRSVRASNGNVHPINYNKGKLITNRLKTTAAGAGNNVIHVLYINISADHTEPRREEVIE